MTKTKDIQITDIHFEEFDEDLNKYIMINIGTDFSPHPGPRYKKQGDNSAEEFFESKLNDEFKKAKEMDKTIILDLDSVKHGYLASFVEEISGGLVRKYGINNVDEFKKYFRYKTERFKHLLDIFTDKINNQLKK